MIPINKGYFDNEVFLASYFTQPYFGFSYIISPGYIDSKEFELTLNTVFTKDLTLNSQCEDTLSLNTQINFEIER